MKEENKTIDLNEKKENLNIIKNYQMIIKNILQNKMNKKRKLLKLFVSLSKDYYLIDNELYLNHSIEETFRIDVEKISKIINNIENKKVNNLINVKRYIEIPIELPSLKKNVLIEKHPIQQNFDIYDFFENIKFYGDFENIEYFIKNNKEFIKHSINEEHSIKIIKDFFNNKNENLIMFG
jgi:hypothetical protein